MLPLQATLRRLLEGAQWKLRRGASSKGCGASTISWRRDGSSFSNYSRLSLSRALCRRGCGSCRRRGPRERLVELREGDYEVHVSRFLLHTSPTRSTTQET